MAEPATGKRTSLQGLWSSRLAFVLAVAGSAVGLGNIWKFPYTAGDNGGGAFVLIYLVCVVAVGLPIMMAEVLLGRRGRRNPVDTMRILGEEEANTAVWRLVGLMGVGGGFLILSFYSVVAGWALDYIVKGFSGAFNAKSAEEIASMFQTLTGSWVRLGFWHTLFMVMTVWVVARGVERGLEQAVRILMPALLILMLVLVGYSITQGHFMQGVHFLFDPDFSKVTPDVVLVALGQAFFTLSIGMGAVMAYGAYLPEGTSIVGTTLAVVIADTVIALLAGLAIFPIVFAYGLQPAQEEGLLFMVLPVAFGQMPAGNVFGTLFFVLLAFAAWTSSIGLIEPAVAYLTERKGMTRRTAAWAVGGIIWALGFATILSFNVLSDVTFWRGTLFDNLIHLTSNIMLPLGGLLIAVFAGWIMCRNSSAEELDMGTGTLYQTWRFLARYVAPVAVILILLNFATGGWVTRLLGG